MKKDVELPCGIRMKIDVPELQFRRSVLWNNLKLLLDYITLFDYNLIYTEFDSAQIFFLIVRVSMFHERH